MLLKFNCESKYLKNPMTAINLSKSYPKIKKKIFLIVI